jgi:hypothetical protein
VHAPRCVSTGRAAPSGACSPATPACERVVPTPPRLPERRAGAADEGFRGRCGRRCGRRPSSLAAPPRSDTARHSDSVTRRAPVRHGRPKPGRNQWKSGGNPCRATARAHHASRRPRPPAAAASSAAARVTAPAVRRARGENGGRSLAARTPGDGRRAPRRPLRSQPAPRRPLELPARPAPRVTRPPGRSGADRQQWLTRAVPPPAAAAAGDGRPARPARAEPVALLSPGPTGRPPGGPAGCIQKAAPRPPLHTQASVRRVPVPASPRPGARPPAGGDCASHIAPLPHRRLEKQPARAPASDVRSRSPPRDGGPLQRAGCFLSPALATSAAGAPGGVWARSFSESSGRKWTPPRAAPAGRPGRRRRRRPTTRRRAAEQAPFRADAGAQEGELGCRPRRARRATRHHPIDASKRRPTGGPRTVAARAPRQPPAPGDRAANGGALLSSPGAARRAGRRDAGAPANENTPPLPRPRRRPAARLWERTAGGARGGPTPCQFNTVPGGVVRCRGRGSCSGRRAICPVSVAHC